MTGLPMELNVETWGKGVSGYSNNFGLTNLEDLETIYWDGED